MYVQNWKLIAAGVLAVAYGTLALRMPEAALWGMIWWFGITFRCPNPWW